MADTPIGETANPGDSKTEGTTVATPVVNATDNAEAEQLKKELEQARMRASQLENQVKKNDEEKAEAERKQLEENNEWKTLAEQEKARREELETQAETEKRTKELKEATDTVLSEYSDAVKEIAEEAGLTALDNSEEEVARFKGRLDKISAKLPTSQVSANNPQNPTSTNQKLSSDEMKLALKDEKNFHDLITKLPGVASMTAQPRK